MDNFARLRRARTRVVKVQRRIWLVQATLWPAVVLGSVAIATTAAYLAWRRRAAEAAVSEFTTATPYPATEISAATNGTG